MDRIFITNHKIEFRNDEIHVFVDSSLYLYHPLIDKLVNGIISTVQDYSMDYRMVPFYGEWKSMECG